MNFLKIKIALLTIISVLPLNCLSAENIEIIDTLASYKQHYKYAYTIPFLAMGIASHGYDNDFRNSMKFDAAMHKSTIDDIAQYTPAALMLALKAAGVESRSSWGRMLTADAFSAALYFGATQALKNSINSVRPDGSDAKSFPSGHTTLAFMAATMLHKEYGGVSPWFSFAGYTIASGTAMARVLNNRHWASDVLTGAGIGILATQLGYLFSDLIFKKKGLKIFDTSIPAESLPSYLSIGMGLAVPLNEMKTPDGTVIKLANSVRSSISGAFYFNRHWGIGGNASLTGLNQWIDNEAQSKTTQMWSIGAGPDFSCDIIPQLSFGARAHITYSYYPQNTLHKVILLGNRGGIGMNTDISFTIFPYEKFALRIDAGYSLSPEIIKGSGHPQFFTITTSGAIRF